MSHSEQYQLGTNPSSIDLELPGRFFLTKKSRELFCCHEIRTPGRDETHGKRPITRALIPQSGFKSTQIPTHSKRNPHVKTGGYFYTII